MALFRWAMNWVNVSYNDPVTKRHLDDTCGPPYGFWTAVRKGGIGSPRLTLAGASDGLMAPFHRSEDRGWASIEIRPFGSVLRCRSMMETLALAIPHGSVTGMVLTAPGRSPHGDLTIQGRGGFHVLLHVRRDHWSALARLLRSGTPEGLFRTAASIL